jgi:hypothetical protein
MIPFMRHSWKGRTIKVESQGSGGLGLSWVGGDKMTKHEGILRDFKIVLYLTCGGDCINSFKHQTKKLCIKVNFIRYKIIIKVNYYSFFLLLSPRNVNASLDHQNIDGENCLETGNILSLKCLFLKDFLVLSVKTIQSRHFYFMVPQEFHNSSRHILCT